MNENKKKILNSFIMVGIPALVIVNLVIIFLIPEELLIASDETMKVKWFAARSAPASMVTSMLVFAGVFRYWMNKYKD